MNPAHYDRDQDHLKLLSIFHYIVGGMIILMSSFFIIHLVALSIMLKNPEMLPQPPGGQQIPEQLWFFLLFFVAVAILLGWIFGILTIVSGRMMAKRRAHVFSIVIASLICFWFPFGTALGVCTILVLSRDSVHTLYAQSTLTQEGQQLP